MDSNSSSSAPRGDAHTANIGAGAQIDQFAQGENITQIKGYTAEQVRVLIADLRASYQPKPFDGRSPYVGLASFQEQDADRFFGREKLTQELVARIATARFVVIAGPSGSGKSSLARAGLFHALRNSALDGSENWLYEILTPGRHPLDQLARVVSSFAKSTNAGDEMQQRGRADATLLHRWADIALGDQRTRRALLLVDQFEESFTQADENERAAFFNLLLYAATVENGRVTIVCGTRSDFIGNWAAYPKLNALLNQGIHQIPPMQPDELVSAIARPALQVGLQIDPELVKQILDDMRDAPGALPLMQFALDDLFEYAKSKGGVIALTRDDYLARGGLQQALSRHADAEFAKLNADEQHIARNVFANLIEPGRGSVDTKRTALLSELVPSSTDAAQVKNVVGKLADARLVTTDAKTVTLAHERMIDAWSWLRRLVNENREAIALQNQINQDAQEWEQSQRDASYLYTGARLATAQEQVAGKKIELGALAREFVDEGIAARDEAKRKEAQRTRRLIMAFGAAAVVFAVLAVVAFLAQQNAIRSEARAIEQQQTAEAERDRAEQAEADALSALDAADTAAREAGRQKILADSAKATAVAEAAIARSRELAALARSQFETNPDLAMLIAMEANKKAEAVTFESEDALRQILVEHRLETILRGHQERVLGAAFSPDNTRLVTASRDGTAKVWDIANGNLITTLRGHKGPVENARFSLHNTRIITTGDDKTVRIWDATSGNPLIILSGHTAAVLDAQFSHDATRAVTASADGTARIWDAVSGTQLALMSGHTKPISSVQFSPDDNEILTASNDGTARVWDTVSGKERLRLHGETDPQTSHHFFIGGVAAQFSPDGKRILTANFDDKTARVWDSANGQQLVALRGHRDGVTSAQFSPDGTKIVTGSPDNTARIWDSQSGIELLVLSGHENEVVSTQFSPDGNHIVSASSDGTARIWDAVNGNELAVLRGHSYALEVAYYSSDGKRIVTVGTNDDTVHLWNAVGDREFSVIRLPLENVTGADFCIDQQSLATTTNATTAKIWNLGTGQVSVLLEGHTLPVRSVKFSHDCSRVITGSEDKTARSWDTYTGKGLLVLPGHEWQVNDAAFSDDGSKVVTSSVDKTARVWDAMTGKQIVVLRGHTHPVGTARFSSDGQMIVTSAAAAGDKSGDETARLWDANTGKELVIFSGHQDTLTNTEFSPSADKIVSASNDGTARVWDVSNGDVPLSVLNHEGRVNYAQFSSDSKRILTAGADKLARLWNAASGRELAILRGSDSEVITARFSGDGNEIYTVSQDGTIRIYLSNVSDLVDLAKKRIKRELTCEERVQYLREQIVCPTPTPQN